MSESRQLYHVALPEDWEAAMGVGVYDVSTRGRTLAEEGFIHASFEHQLRRTIETLYGDVEEVVVLVIDSDALDAPVVEESPSGDPADEQFPHIYGPIPVKAVVDVRRMPVPVRESRPGR